MKPAGAPPLRPLAALTLAVLALHVLLLQVRPGALSLNPTLATGPLVTRTIVLRPPEAAPAAGAPRPDALPASPAKAPPKALPARMESDLAATKNVATPDAESRQAGGLTEPPPRLPTVQAVPGREPDPPADTARPRDAIPAAAAFNIPGSQQLRYRVTGEVKGQPYQASATLRWRQNGGDYEARLEVGALLVGLRQQLSTGRITPEGLAPTRFSDKSRSEQAAHFERDKGHISFSSNAPSAPLLAGAQDRLSVLIQLGAMIAAEPARFGPETTITVQTASVREADQWLFTVVRSEVLQLPGGELATLRLLRNPRREYDQKVEVWYAPGMDYMPVRVRLTQPNGDFVDQQWLATERM